MAKKLDRNADFTFAELVEYETMIGEPLDALNDEERPRLKKIATLGFLRARREDEGLLFVNYIEENSTEQILIDAFGDQSEEKKESTTSASKGQTARRGSA